MAIYLIRRAGVDRNIEVEADDVNCQDGGVLNFWKYQQNGTEDSVTVFVISACLVEYVQRIKD